MGGLDYQTYSPSSDGESGAEMDGITYDKVQTKTRGIRRNERRGKRLMKLPVISYSKTQRRRRRKGAKLVHVTVANNNLSKSSGGDTVGPVPGDCAHYNTACRNSQEPEISGGQANSVDDIVKTQTSSSHPPSIQIHASPPPARVPITTVFLWNPLPTLIILGTLTIVLGLLVILPKSRHHFINKSMEPDFALYSEGGRVISEYTSKPFGWHCKNCHMPVEAIYPNLTAKSCWAFTGARGQVGLYLAHPVRISHFGIDHAAMDLETSSMSPPRRMSVWGAIEGAESDRKVREYRGRRTTYGQEDEEMPAPDELYKPSRPHSPDFIRLAHFTYDLHSFEHRQNFLITREIWDLDLGMSIIVLMVEDNWGGNVTCLYRVRVHGYPSVIM